MPAVAIAFAGDRHFELDSCVRIAASYLSM